MSQFTVKHILLFKLGKCSKYQGLENPNDPSQCCSKDCFDYCGAKNCEDGGLNKCCFQGISSNTSNICGNTYNTNTGIKKRTAPCTLSNAFKISKFLLLNDTTIYFIKRLRA